MCSHIFVKGFFCKYFYIECVLTYLFIVGISVMSFGPINLTFVKGLGFRV